ncbi:hypothetical protein BHE74_00054209, partial [Ensete ventricosum]
SEEEGQPTTANPHVGPATHGQAVARASPQGRPAPLAREATRKGGAYGHD